MDVTPDDLRERVRRVPGMERVIPALEGLRPAYLVGGAVRDLLRGSPAVDLDIAIEGDARAAARTLAERLGGAVREHERFGTATVRAEELSFDLATTRRESYERPGALPLVEPASLDEDLARRDFAFNAMAVGLTGDDLGHLYDPHCGLADLGAGSVRVLHERSFTDDPTRLLRALRYEARLGFAMHPDTEQLATRAVEEGALGTVSGPRVRDELMDLLAEHQAAAAVARMADLQIDRALHPALAADAALVASASLGAITVGADPALTALAALCSEAPEQLDGWLAELHLTAPQRDSVARAARAGEPLSRELHSREHRPSELAALLAPEPPEALALALALGAPPEPILRWAEELRGVRLEISGDDLIAAGVPEGPRLGRALQETLARKLEGLVAGREQELETALQLAREES